MGAVLVPLAPSISLAFAASISLYPSCFVAASQKGSNLKISGKKSGSGYHSNNVKKKIDILVSKKCLSLAHSPTAYPPLQTLSVLPA
jgi:hypothetical protein